MTELRGWMREERLSWKRGIGTAVLVVAWILVLIAACSTAY